MWCWYWKQRSSEDIFNTHHNISTPSFAIRKTGASGKMVPAEVVRSE
jgi:hypothetical protein